MEILNLSNLGGGAAAEKFDHELRRVIRNIMDPNTPATTKREITLKVIIAPSENRSWGAIEVTASCKLASDKPFATRAYFGVEGEEFIACEDNPEQITINDFIESKKQTEVVDLKKVSGKND